MNAWTDSKYYHNTYVDRQQRCLTINMWTDESMDRSRCVTTLTRAAHKDAHIDPPQMFIYSPFYKTNLTCGQTAHARACHNKYVAK